MLVVVAIGAEVFPIAAVRRVVGRVAVLVVDGEEMEAPPVELPPALGANPSVEGEGALPISGLLAGPCVLHEVPDLIGLNLGLERPSTPPTFSESRTRHAKSSEYVKCSLSRGYMIPHNV
jgi:hypothetical protein